MQGLQLGRPRQALCLGFFSRAKGFFSALIFFRGMRFRDGKPARIPATEPGPEFLPCAPFIDSVLSPRLSFKRKTLIAHSAQK